jgi:sterol desaturase/sphingolipid hydroxylase (fatty acid hydroxylase superfamily)
VLAYWVHFAFHNVRVLWRIHAFHHALTDFVE